jgi:L,D-transpeptidase ErfK/SrfK
MTRACCFSGYFLKAERFIILSLCFLCMICAGSKPIYANEAPLPSHKPKQSLNKSLELIFVGDMRTHEASYKDTLVKLARENNLGFVELRSANPFIDPWLPGEGTEILLPTRHLLPDAPREGIVINLPEMRLYYFQEEGAVPVTFPIGVGREGLRTPEGTTRVRKKKVGPTWHPTKRMREENPDLPKAVPPGPDNPLGSHILYLAWPEYAIHGTNKPFGIGRRVSSGCIRMYPESIIELYEMVEEGTMVTVINQPLKAAWIENKLYLEAHPTMKQAGQMETEGGIPDYSVSEAEMAALMKVVGYDVDLLDWEAVQKVIRSRSGYPIVVATRPDSSQTGSNSSDIEDEKVTKASEPDKAPVFN